MNAKKPTAVAPDAAGPVVPNESADAAAVPPQRADARRNRARVLRAAEEAFATEGLAVPLDEIARRAGVGAGTVHRHFPTKEALFEAVMHSRAEEYNARARELCSSDDPGKGFAEFLVLMFDEGGVKRDLFDALGQAGVDVTRAVEGNRRELREAIGELLRRAQRAGAIRDDIGVAELLVIIAGITMAGGKAKGADLRRRVMDVILDGLTAGTSARPASP